MVTMSDVTGLAEALPEVSEGTSYGKRSWFVGGKHFVWERPFSKADIKRFGDEPIPEGPILAVRVEDLADKEAVLAANPDSFFTILHFEGYPAVLIQLEQAERSAVRDAIVDGWLSCAPKPLVETYLSEHKPPD